MMINENDLQNQTEQKVRCFYATMHIYNSKYSRLYSKPSKNFLDQQLVSLQHKKKKPNQKLVQMHFLKDSKMIVLGYDKQSERGDINFIDVGQPKIKDFFYNKLVGGIGGVQCFDDGKLILIADRKGMFSYIDLFKALNLNDIEQKRIQTSIEGILDLSLSPSQTKVACGLADKKCIVIDIQKDKKNKQFPIQKTFDHHFHGVNSIDWHPYKSLVVSSSIHIDDTIKLWDPHSQELVHEANMHKNIVSKVMFHPQGNTYFSLSKDNVVEEHEIRHRGVINKFHLDFQPNHIKVLNDRTIVTGDCGGYMTWFTHTGQLIHKFKGPSGVALFDIDQTNSLLVLGRQRQHMFEVYTKSDGYKIQQY